MYGDYKIIQYQFGDNNYDTLAFVIDEGTAHHILKNNFQTIKDASARCLILVVPNALEDSTGTNLYLINIYVPPANHSNHNTLATSKNYYLNITSQLQTQFSLET
jgi:hypothetical protein